MKQHTGNPVINPKSKKQKICLAIQGGGAYGAYTWGILDKFLEDGRFEIDAISATSSGSVNAVVLAHALTISNNYEIARAELHNLWCAISELGNSYSPIRENSFEHLAGYELTSQISFQLFDNLSRVLSPYFLNPLNINPLRDMLKEKIDFDVINQGKKIKLFLCATNVKTGRLKIFNNEEINIDALMASACLPDFYQAVKINEDYYWDGGFLGNPAIFPLIYHSSVDDILILHTNPFVRNSIPITSTEIQNRLNEISFNSSLIRELRAIAFVTKLLDEGYIKEECKEKVRRKFIHIIRSDEVMSRFNLLDKYRWSWDALTNLRDLGRAVAAKWLKDHYSAVGERSTLDFTEFL